MFEDVESEKGENQNAEEKEGNIFIFQHVILDAEKDKPHHRKEKKEPKYQIKLVIQVSFFKQFFP